LDKAQRKEGILRPGRDSQKKRFSKEKRGGTETTSEVPTLEMDRRIVEEMNSNEKKTLGGRKVRNHPTVMKGRVRIGKTLRGFVTLSTVVRLTRRNCKRQGPKAN